MLRFIWSSGWCNMSSVWSRFLGSQYSFSHWQLSLWFSYKNGDCSLFSVFSPDSGMTAELWSPEAKSWMSWSLESKGRCIHVKGQLYPANPLFSPLILHIGVFPHHMPHLGPTRLQKDDPQEADETYSQLMLIRVCHVSVLENFRSWQKWADGLSVANMWEVLTLVIQSS